jgi:hypothetical protein
LTPPLWLTSISLRAVVKRTGSDTPSITRAWSWSPGARGSNILMRPGGRQTGRDISRGSSAAAALCVNDEITRRFNVMRVHPGDVVILI